MRNEMTREPAERKERSPHQYLGQDVEQAFLDDIVKTYRGAYEAAHPEHTPPSEDDAAILALLAKAEVRGGPDADALGRQRAVEAPIKARKQ
jgi:hypothetical protein